MGLSMRRRVRGGWRWGRIEDRTAEGDPGSVGDRPDGPSSTRQAGPAEVRGPGGSRGPPVGIPDVGDGLPPNDIMAGDRAARAESETSDPAGRSGMIRGLMPGSPDGWHEDCPRSIGRDRAGPTRRPGSASDRSPRSPAGRLPEIRGERPHASRPVRRGRPRRRLGRARRGRRLDRRRLPRAVARLRHRRPGLEGPPFLQADQLDQPGDPHRLLADQVRLHRRPGRRPGHPARHPDGHRGRHRHHQVHRLQGRRA